VHIGLNLIYLVPRETGGRETYANELVAALRRLAPDVRLTAFMNREAEAIGTPIADQIATVTVPVHARNRLSWAFGEQALLPRLAARAGVDVLHSLGNTAPLRGPFRRVVTVHDLLYHFYPQFVAPGLRAGTRVLVPLGARRADRVITPSAAASAEVVTHLRIPPERIDVVAHGVGATPTAVAGAAEAVRERHGLGRRPLVFTSSLRLPHKNLDGLLAGVARIPAAERPLVVVAGHGAAGPDPLVPTVERLDLQHDVRLLGWLPAEDVEGLYAAAALYVVPSLYEGFGLPVLEAMTRGTPVACSDIDALREVSGGAAELFDPRDPAAIATAVRTVLRDDALAAGLRAAGARQAATYTWDAAARGTLRSYERALGRSTASAVAS
jgi:glycosyltransferase involved in cell wall biosynthesis